MDTNSGYEPRTDLPSRRDFIRGSSLVGVGAATAGLVGCNTTAQDDAAARERRSEVVQRHVRPEY